MEYPRWVLLQISSILAVGSHLLLDRRTKTTFRTSSWPALWAKSWGYRVSEDDFQTQSSGGLLFCRYAVKSILLSLLPQVLGPYHSRCIDRIISKCDLNPPSAGQSLTVLHSGTTALFLEKNDEVCLGTDMYTTNLTLNSNLLGTCYPCNEQTIYYANRTSSRDWNRCGDPSLGIFVGDALLAS